MEKERTFIDPLFEADYVLRECKADLAALARALHMVGNEKLADRLATIATDINGATVLMGEGRDLALGRVVRGAEQATANMVNAALAVTAKCS